MVRQLLECNFENFEVQTVLTFEMIIYGSLIDASFGDDVSHARTLEAFLREQIDGGLDNGVAGGFVRGGPGVCNLTSRFARVTGTSPPKSQDFPKGGGG